MPKVKPKFWVRYKGATINYGAAVILLVLGILGRNSYTPIIIDKVFGISSYVQTQINKRVDSGYSRSFIFSNVNKVYDNQIFFFAERGQRVTVTIRTAARGAGPSRFKTTIDGVPWEEREAPYQIVHGEITEKLRFDNEPGGNIHVLRFIPVKVDSNGPLVIDSLVLVHN